jgi:hypothetical protein
MSITNRINKGIATLCMIAALAGCSKNPEHFTKKFDYKGYNAWIEHKNNGRKITLIEKTKDFYKPAVWAQDNENDGRWDRLELVDVPKGHPLEEYASFEKLEQAYQAVTESVNKQ